MQMACGATGAAFMTCATMPTSVLRRPCCDSIAWSVDHPAGHAAPQLEAKWWGCLAVREAVYWEWRRGTLIPHGGR